MKTKRKSKDDALFEMLRKWMAGRKIQPHFSPAQMDNTRIEMCVGMVAAISFKLHFFRRFKLSDRHIFYHWIARDAALLALGLPQADLEAFIRGENREKVIAAHRGNSECEQ